MNDGRWRISVTAPDWGQDHLSSDAIVAFVDDELADGPHHRAVQHLAQCPECAAQVVAQGQTRSALRAAHCPGLPSSLIESLRSIPQNADLPAPPPGLAMTADGQFVSVLRPRPVAERPAVPPRRPSSQRLRLGTGVTVSGLALGALAFGVPAASSNAVVPVPPAADRGTVGASLSGGPGVVDASLRLAPAVRPDPLDRSPGSAPGGR